MEIMFSNDEVAYEISTYLGLEDDEIKLFRSKKIPKKIAKKVNAEKLANKKKAKIRSQIYLKEENLLYFQVFLHPLKRNLLLENFDIEKIKSEKQVVSKDEANAKNRPKMIQKKIKIF